MTQKTRVYIPALSILLAAFSAVVAGQGGDSAGTLGGPFTGSPVLGAPFSADATTTLTYTLDNGAERTTSAIAHYYRDAEGRVRVEQTAPMFITIDVDPSDGIVYTLDPRRRLARPQGRGGLSRVFNGGSSFALPVGVSQFRFRVYSPPRVNDDTAESLGTRTVEGLSVSGRRFRTPVVIGHLNNQEPLEIVDERWVSSDLGLVVYARTSDPITGVFEYRLTNIRRDAPAADLFVMPTIDYAIDHCPNPADPCISLESMRQANRQYADGSGPIVSDPALIIVTFFKGAAA